MTATASSNTGAAIRYVDFYVNGSFIHSDSSTPYSFKTANDAPGTLALTAVATDKSGNSAVSAPVTISIVQDVPPAVVLTSPADGSTYVAKSTVSLAATASSQYANVTSVTFYDGGATLKKVTAAPYAFTWTKVETGTHTVTAVAVDDQGLQTTSAPVTITVN
jgi:chitinase